MQYRWLNKKENDNLIIFFCGWSFDEVPFKGLDCGDYDVLIIYDYGDISQIFSDKKLYLDTMHIFDELSQYNTRTLITWSMGVYVAYLLADVIPEFNKKIAINGTPCPIHDEWGIPEKTFNLTLKFVDSGLEGKFEQNLFKLPEQYKKYLANPVKRTKENRKQELIALNDFIKSREYEYDEFYDYAIISDTDKIIPTRNQLDFWGNNAEIITLNSGHFPFYEFNSWEELINANKP